LWIGLGGVAALTVITLALVFMGNFGEEPSSPAISAPISVSGEKTTVPTSTRTPAKTSATSRPTDITQTTDTDKTVYDYFNSDHFDTSLWRSVRYGSTRATSIEQNRGRLELKYTGNGEFGIAPIKVTNAKIIEPIFYEARIYLEPSTSPTGTQMFIEIGIEDSWTACFISNSGNEKQHIGCSGAYFGIDFTNKIDIKNLNPSWHVLRIEFWPKSFEIALFIDGMLKGTLLGNDFSKAQEVFEQKYPSVIGVNMNNFIDSVSPVGYVDYVRSGKVADDPTLYDNFNNSKHDGIFDVTKWAYEERDPDGSIVQQDGALVFTQSGISQSQLLRASKFWPYELQNSIAIEANLKSDMTSDGSLVLRLTGDIIESASCGLHSMSDFVMAHCWERSMSPENAIPVGHGTWHNVRIEINLETNTISFFMDGKKLMDDHYERSLKGSEIYLDINVSAMVNRANNTRPMVGYVDDVRIMPLEYVNP
jgi:hypothetical protein